MYKRFIDDGFFVWEHGMPALQAFMHALNTATPGVHITWHASSTSIPFMDLVISKDLSVLGPQVPVVIRTYQKPHNRYLYIPRVSFHRPQVFGGLVRGELIRYAVTNTRPEGFERLKRAFMRRLLARGYPKAWLETVFATVLHSDRVAHLGTQQQRRHLAAQSNPPVYVSPCGVYEMHTSIGAVINAVHRTHMHQPQVRAALGDTGRITVAYTAGRSFGSLLVSSRFS